MKHLAILILAAMVTTGFWYTTLAQTAPPFEATVLQTARLRAGPGTTFAIVGSAAPGQVVNVAARSGLWGDSLSPLPGQPT